MTSRPGNAVLPASMSRCEVNIASRLSLAERPGRGSGTGGSAKTKAACTKLALAGPAPIQRRLAGAGARRDPLHGQPAVPDLGQFVQRGLVERMLEHLTPPTAAVVCERTWLGSAMAR